MHTWFPLHGWAPSPYDTVVFQERGAGRGACGRPPRRCTPPACVAACVWVCVWVCVFGVMPSWCLRVVREHFRGPGFSCACMCAHVRVCARVCFSCMWACLPPAAEASCGHSCSWRREAGRQGEAGESSSPPTHTPPLPLSPARPLPVIHTTNDTHARHAGMHTQCSQESCALRGAPLALAPRPRGAAHVRRTGMHAQGCVPPPPPPPME